MTETMMFTRADVAALLPPGECIAAVQHAFWRLGRGLAEPPATLEIRSGAGTFHVKAGVLQHGARRYFAAKTNGNFPDNPARLGLPTIQGLLFLSDADNGRVLAVMDSGEITALRTGAATAIAARFLARADAQVIAICGCGIQGRAQLSALAQVLAVTRVHAYDVDLEKARRYAREMSAALHIPVTAEAVLATAVAHADVCVTCTSATDFMLHHEMVRPGTFIAGVGTDNEGKRELAPGLLAGASKLVTDLRDQCAVMGDLHHALDASAMTLSDVHADLGEVVAGTRSGRETDEEIIVFDSTGLALQDVAAAAAIYETQLDREAEGDVATPLTIAFA